MAGRSTSPSSRPDADALQRGAPNERVSQWSITANKNPNPYNQPTRFIGVVALCLMNIGHGFFELARVFKHLDHLARFTINADHSVV
jgi:hypothetical protein